MSSNGEINRLQSIVDQRLRSICLDDIGNVIQSKSQILVKLKEIPANYIRLKYQMELAIDIITNHHNGDRTDIPIYTLVMLTTLSLYFLDTDDIIPDNTIGIGFLDDYTLGEIIFNEIREDLEKYCEKYKLDLSNCYT